MSPQRFSRSFIASVTGSIIVNAISLAVGRPCEVVDALVDARELFRFAADERNAIELALAVAIGHEAEPRAVRRKRRLAAGLARVGDLAGLARSPHRQSRFRSRTRSRPSWFRGWCRRPAGRSGEIAGVPDALEVDHVVDRRCCRGLGQRRRAVMITRESPRPRAPGGAVCWAWIPRFLSGVQRGV